MKRPLQALLIAPDPDMRRAVIDGRKQITIREGHRAYTAGPAALFCHLEPWAVMVDIVDVKHTELRSVTEEEWVADGFTSMADMLAGMRRFYPTMNLDSPVTIIRWANAQGKFIDDPDLHEQHLAGLL